MTSTNIHVGLTEGTRSSSKVLKPPGGGSSDIFGSAVPNTPRGLTKNRMASNIFNAPSSDVKNGNGNGNGIGESARRQPQANSYNRLFGESERPPVTPSKNHFKSSIPFAVDAVDGVKPLNGNGSIPNGNGHINGNGVTHTNGNGTHEGSKIQNGGSTNGQKAEPVPGSPRNMGVLPSETPRSLIVNTSFGHTPSIHLNGIGLQIRNDTNGCATMANGHASPHSVESTLSSASTTNRSALSASSLNSASSNSLASRSPKLSPRNPVLGIGCIDRDSFRRPRKVERDGNPITGEGYKSGEINTTVPSLNGNRQVINKNRIPPGGFSSGLW